MAIPKMVDGLRNLVSIYNAAPNAGSAGIVIQSIQTPMVMQEFVDHPNSALSLIEDIVNLGQILQSVYLDTQAPTPAHAYGPMADAVLGAYWNG